MPHIISGNSHSTESKQHVPFRVELQNDMRTDIGSPDVVLGIDPHHMCCYKQVVGNAAQEFARRVEFHEWMFAPMKHILRLSGLDFPLTAWIVRSEPLIGFAPVIAELYHALVERL
jgi:hypothetical protein